MNGWHAFRRDGIGRTIDRLQLVYVGLVSMQVITLMLYEARIASGSLLLALGLSTSLAGPGLSVVVGMHIFQRRSLSRTLGIARVAATYLVTCLSFAIIYALVAEWIPHAFSLPASEPDRLGLGSALYFSFVTITTTGYGDIAPIAGLARVAVCCEIGIGMLYQVFVFSLAASVVGSAVPRAAESGATEGA